jgi:hypothetical protein
MDARRLRGSRIWGANIDRLTGPTIHRMKGMKFSGVRNLEARLPEWAQL